MTSSVSRYLLTLVFSALTVAGVPLADGSKTASAATARRPPCSYSLSTTTQSFLATSGLGTFTVTANGDWSAMSTVNERVLRAAFDALVRTFPVVTHFHRRVIQTVQAVGDVPDDCFFYSFVGLRPGNGNRCNYRQ